MQVKLATACIGCGEPVSVTLPQTYATEQGCKEAGNVWLSLNANPVQTVASHPRCGDVRSTVGVTKLEAIIARGLQSGLDPAATDEDEQIIQ